MAQSVERALQLLDELGAGPMRLGPLADKLGVHKSTALRLLQTLERYRYVRREGEAPDFALGLRIVELSGSLLESLDLRQVAAKPLKRLGSLTGETVHLAVRDGAAVIYMDKVESSHPVRMYSRVGARAPIYCTGVGKVLLAYTPVEEWPEMDLRRFTDNTITTKAGLLAAAREIRDRGWGRDEQEHEGSIHCVAAPVFGPDADIVAAVSVSVPTSRLSTEELDGHLPALIEATTEITTALGGRAPRPA
ncbi:IclR family transcriptional regulator [Plantactinospora sp. GCM10030261]|uniref:IclR family transcriptional regulator n=1 Tax=Plantactinospora sp. GCM10030261 TaxID=3273420 RepID=UPI0036245F67